jgi:WD40 repeat protein
MSFTPSNFYVTGGTLQLDALSYVERRADRDLLEGLIAGEFCYVLTSRQMGKSSLMVRTASKLRERTVVILDLSALGQNMTSEQWYNGLLTSLGEQLGLEDELDEFWTAHETLGPVQRWFAALTKVVLLSRKNPVVVFIDEIDVVRSLPFSTDEFFAALRECYNRRARDPEFHRLTFCLLGVATPVDLVRNTNITPFNIGRRIDLSDFTPEEAAPLAGGLHAQPASGAKLLGRVLYWTNGHPYLTQRLCQALARDRHPKLGADVDRACDDLFLNARARERDDNLIFVRERILRSGADLTALLELYLAVWSHRRTFADEANPLISILRLAGIVRSEDGFLIERNRIYHSVFNRAWIRANLPDAELRRQQVAFRQGIFRTAAVASIIIGLLTVAVLVAVDQTRKTRLALAKAYFAQAQARRVTGTSGQRYESIAALAKASRYYPDKAQLRDELVACLALPDLKEEPVNYPWLEGIETYEINPALGLCAAADKSGALTVRSLSDGQVLQSISAFGSPVMRLRFGPDKTVLLAQYEAGSSTQSVIVWNWTQASRLFSIPNGIHADAVDFSPDGRKLAVCGTNGQLTIYRLPEGDTVYQRKLRLESGFPRLPQVLRFDPSGGFVAESCRDSLNVQIWSVREKRKGDPLRLYHPDRVNDLSWHSGGELLATGCDDALIYLWNAHERDRVPKKFAGHDSAVTHVAFNQPGTMLASTSRDETLRLWITAIGRPVIERLKRESLDRLRFNSANNQLFAIGTGQRTPRRWDISGEEYSVLQLRISSYDFVRTVDFAPNGRWLAAATAERATIWDVASEAELSLMTVTNAHAAAFTSDSRFLVSTDKALSEYALTSVSPRHLQHRLSCTLAEASEAFRAMAITPDRKRLAMVNQREVLLMPLGTNCPPLAQAFPLSLSYQRLALHPRAKWLAASSEASGTVDVWNLAENTAKQTPFILPASEYFGFSPDGQWFFTCWNGAFQFYHPGAGTNPVFRIARQLPSDQYAPVAFADSLVAVASTRDKIELRRWTGNEASPTELIATLESPDRQPLEMLAFSPDGRRLAAGTAKLTVQFWNLALVRQQLADLKLENTWPAYE